MKKFMSCLILPFIIFLSSCGTNTKVTKYSPGDTWIVQLSNEFSLECHFDEINDKQLVFTLTKENIEDDYNFAIKADMPCDDIYVNDERICMKSPVVILIPISFYDVEHFKEKNKIVIPFRNGTEEFKKINIESYEYFIDEYNRDFIGIRVILYKN